MRNDISSINKSERRTKIKKEILSTLAVAGVVTTIILFPGMVQVFGYIIKNSRQRSDRYRYFGKVVKNLELSGFVVLTQNDYGQTVVRLTPKGEEEVLRYGLGEKLITKPKKWDGKYRIIIFDIKEWKRGVRDVLRDWLVSLGFRQLQRSVWVYPYECRDVIVMLKAKFKIGREVLYITADEIENDHWLRRDFGLDKD